MQIKPFISYRTFVLCLILFVLLYIGSNIVLHPWQNPFANYKIPHFEKLELDIDKVKWFRIWYGAGHENNNFGDKYGYYAVSGGNTKLKKCGIYDDLSAILDSINSIKIYSKDFCVFGNHIDGRDEYVSIRLKFKNKPYSKLGDFKLYYAFSADTVDHANKTEYIMLIHSDYTRYLIKKVDYPSLVHLFEKLTYREYGDCMESRMM